ncbi:TPA: aspartate kinase [Candidatus Latescibacteria bacterium]|nr:aspartate kinase [Candidatus Latescibacterota bacterium]
MGDIVCKFGGSSLADEDQIRKAIEIVEARSERRFVVPSAPGKRDDGDTKVTDLLYLCHELARQKVDIAEPFSHLKRRFLGITEALGLDLDMKGLLDQLRVDIEQGASTDYVASRGEHLNGRILAAALRAKFVEPAEVIRFGRSGTLDPDSYDGIARKLSGSGRFVIPGFYGAEADGEIKTFSRGGSDITGAVVARAISADVYENWTDVSGMLMADPRVVSDAKPVTEITYREIRELAYMGASVFHDEAMFPVREAGIPVNIRNTNRPDDAGTMILPERDMSKQALAGVAGRANFSMLFIEKALMNQTKGFGRRVLDVIVEQDISYEHSPSGIDTMSVIISDDELGGKGPELVSKIEQVLQPDRVTLLPGLALIATVGEGMSHRIGIAARLFAALADAEVNVRVIDQGASEINIIVGVEAADFERAVQAIYQAFEDES